MKLKVLELFGGIGACSKALERLCIDYEIADYVEIDKYAVMSFNAIHNTNFEPQDICEWDKDIEVDLIMHGSPCQDFSLAGKQAGGDKNSGTRSSLLWECKKIIEYCKPKYLLMENVKNLVGKKHKVHFDKWLVYLESLGYTNYWQVLKPYKFPKPIELDKCIADILESEVEEKYYINKPFKLVDRGRIKAEFTNINFDQSKRIHGIDSYFQALSAADRGTNNILVVAHLTDLKYKQISRVLSQEGICSTLDTMQGGYREPKVFCDGEKSYRVRKLTPRECFRLMGMKDSDIDKIQETGLSNSQQYKMAGNSIVVDVLEGIFRNLFL